MEKVGNTIGLGSMSIHMVYDMLLQYSELSNQNEEPGEFSFSIHVWYVISSVQPKYLIKCINIFFKKQSAEISNHHHTQETMKNDLTNTEQLLQTYKQQSESLAERLRQEQASHREVCGYPNLTPT